MFVAAIVLFLLPCSLLWAARARFARSAVEAPPQSWRMYCGKSALILAICSTLLELVFFYSWFHNGGSPHGLTNFWNLEVRRSDFFLDPCWQCCTNFVRKRQVAIAHSCLGCSVFVR